MTREEKLEHLGRAVGHLEEVADMARHLKLDDFSQHLFDAVRSIGAVVEELVKEQMP